MVFSINLDRGVHMRTHPAMNMDIYMYVDDPGIYYSAHGQKVSEDLARAAGFPVDEQLRQHKIKEALKAAHNQVMTEFNEKKTKVVKERGEFQIVGMAHGLHNVLIKGEHEPLNKSPITLEQAEILLDNLAPVEKAPVADAKKK